MAPESEASRSGNSAASWSSERLVEVGDCFGGGVHLAGAQLVSSGVVAVAAGFTPSAARNRADTLVTAVDALHRIPDHATDPEGSDAIDLQLADFMPEPPAEIRSRVAGIGLLSRQRYLLPAEVVRLHDHDRRVEPTMAGIVTRRPYGASSGIADLLSHDVFARWWANPRTPLLRVSGHLPELLPPGIGTALSALGLWLSAFVLPSPDFRLAVVGLGGEGATIATAGARSVRAAVSEAFLRAIAAQAQPWSTLPAADSLRRLTVWHRKTDYLAYLEQSAEDADPATIDSPPAGEEPTAWADIAVRRFGHEPVQIVMGTDDAPVKVVCPGAACYRPALPGTVLPCPVP